MPHFGKIWLQRTLKLFQVTPTEAFLLKSSQSEVTNHRFHILALGSLQRRDVSKRSRVCVRHDALVARSFVQWSNHCRSLKIHCDCILQRIQQAKLYQFKADSSTICI